MRFSVAASIEQETVRSLPTMSKLIGAVGANAAKSNVKRPVESSRAVGVTDSLLLEMDLLELEDGDRFLLCSDGLDKHLKDEEIAQHLAGEDPQAVARVLLQLKKEGFTPDVILAHPGWGETLYAKDVFPHTRLVHYCEWFYNAPPLDVTAIDNLPSLMPVESSEDYAAQLLPSLLTLKALDQGVWGRAKAEFDRHVAGV